MNSEMSPAAMLNDDMMELLLLALLFTAVRHTYVVDMVNNTLLSVMPDLQLEDENGDPTLLQTGVHAVVFVAIWWILGELNMKSLN
jgi:hypothetical protein